MPQLRTDAEGTYQCRTCAQLLPLAEFYASNSRLGHQRECRSCGMERRRQRVVTRREAAIARAIESVNLGDLAINETRTFGIEIECYVPATRPAVATAIRQALHSSCRSERYNHHDGPHWKIVTDATVTSHHAGSAHRLYHGMEIVSPGGEGALRGMAGLAQVQTVMAAIKSLGGIVNRWCGMHIHHYAQDLSLDAWKRLFATYLHFEEAIDSIMPPSRRGTHAHYCSGLRGRTMYVGSGMNETVEHDAYKAIAEAPHATNLGWMFGRGKVNETALSLHGTVEFRHHGGSLSFEKAANWIALTQSMVETAADGTYLPPDNESWAATTPNDLDSLLYVMGASAEMTEFFMSRQRFFAGAGSEMSVEDTDREMVAA